MKRTNPVESQGALISLAPRDILFLDTLEAAYRRLFDGADRLREMGDHRRAEFLEIFGEQIAEFTEQAISDLQEEGGDLDIFGNEATPSLEEELASLWHDWRTHPERFDNVDDLLRVLRGVFPAYGLDASQISDQAILDATEDAYRHVSRVRRHNL